MKDLPEYSDHEHEDEESMLLYEQLFDSARLMPKRPRAHVLETESKAFLRSVFPSSWVIHSSNLDYGEDLRVEIFANNKATGLEFIVQLKATDGLKAVGQDIACRLKTQTVNYLLSKKVPALLVMYDAKARKAYYVWIEEAINKLTKVKGSVCQQRKTIIIKIPATNTLRYSTADIIAGRVFLARRSEDTTPFELINTLSSLGLMCLDDLTISEWLHDTERQKLIDFFLKADPGKLMAKGKLTWDDIYSLWGVWQLGGEIRRAGITFAEKMLVSLIGLGLMDEAATVLGVLSGECNPKSFDALCGHWWKRWFEDPVLEIAFPSMMENIPADPLGAECKKKLLESLSDRFGEELSKVERHLEALDSSDWSTGYSTEKGGVVVEGPEEIGEFVPWLLWYAVHDAPACKTLVKSLNIETETKEALLDRIDEEELLYSQEYAH